jgi:hypothetical protein
MSGYPYSVLEDITYTFPTYSTPFSHPGGMHFNGGVGGGVYIGNNCYPCPTQCSFSQMKHFPCCATSSERIRHIAQEQDHAVMKCRFNPNTHNHTSCHLEVLPKGHSD